MSRIDQVHSEYRELTEQLIRMNRSISFLESCTSGLLSSLLTDTEGASAVFKGSDVVYSNEAKVASGVDETVIEKFGVYSLETAEAMATACRERFCTDIGVGVTGSLGTVDPSNKDSVPGEVYFAIDICGRVTTCFIEVDNSLSRFEGKLFVADAVCKRLMDLVKQRRRLIGDERENMEKTNHVDKARDLFEQGYNCAQAVAGAFAEDFGYSVPDVLKLTAALGGGVARMREVCGTVLGIAVAIGMAEGKETVPERKEKAELYSRVQAVSDKFREENGSIVCGELLQVKRDGSVPSVRDSSFKKRPCKEYVAYAAGLLEQYFYGEPAATESDSSF